jgi:hypothetical protein
MQTRAKIISQLVDKPKSSTFAFLKEYKNKSDEVSDYNFILNIKYSSMIKKSIALLQEVDFAAKSVQYFAKMEILNSLYESLNNPNVDKLDKYYSPVIVDNNIINGLRICKSNNNLHIYGTLVSKKVIIKGNYKQINHSSFTLVKNEIRKTLPISKFRSFIIHPSDCKYLTINNKKIIL